MLYVIISFIYCYIRRKSNLWDKRYFTYILISILAIIQFYPRLYYGAEDGKRLDLINHHERCLPPNRVHFAGDFNCVHGDIYHYVTASGHFRGLEAWNKVNNDRMVAPYLMSLLIPYYNSYYVLHTINFLFYFLLLLIIFYLIKEFKQPDIVCWFAVLIASATKDILMRATDGQFLIQPYIIIIAMIFTFIKLDLNREKPVLRKWIQFIFVMVNLVLMYEAEYLSASLLLFAILGYFTYLKKNRIVCYYCFITVFFAHLVSFTRLPILDLFGLKGKPYATAKNMFIDNLIMLPDYIINNTDYFFKRMLYFAKAFLLSSHYRTPSQSYLTLFAVFSFIFVIPRFTKKEHAYFFGTSFFAIIIMCYVFTMIHLVKLLPAETEFFFLIRTMYLRPLVIIGLAIGSYFIIEKMLEKIKLLDKKAAKLIFYSGYLIAPLVYYYSSLSYYLHHYFGHFFFLF